MEELNEIVSEKQILKATDLLANMFKEKRINENEHYLLIKPVEMALNYYIEQDNNYYCKHRGE